MNDALEFLNNFIINTTGGPEAAKKRQEEAAEQMARIKDNEPNVKLGDDGLLAPTIGDKINNFFGSIGGSAPSMKQVQSEYDTIQNKRKSAELIKKNSDLDYGDIDRSDFQKVQEFTATQRGIKNKKLEGYDVSGVTNLSQLSDTVREQDLDDSNYKARNSYAETQRKQELAAEIARQKARTKRAELESDRNFNINKITALSNAELGVGKLGVDLATLKANTAQAELDREYLDRRDQRDYEYKIKKDSMDNLDKIFQLILLGGDKIF